MTQSRDDLICPDCGSAIVEGQPCTYCETGEDPPTRQIEHDNPLIADRYRLIRRLGRGGMGEVWLAQDCRLDTEVALKFISDKWVRDDDVRGRFYQEILLARQTRHPNIAAVYDLFEDGDRLFFTMEYIPGKTLEEHMRDGLSLSDALKIARELCAGLAALHATRIVHRDIKPNNIKITPEGRTVLFDLGIAKDTSRPGATVPGLVLGTPDHMAPEQLLGRSITPATDVFAVGLVLYEMLTGLSLPTGSDTTLSEARQKTPKPSDVAESIPDWLDRVTMACLDPNPRKRYQDAGELLKDLEAERRRTTQTTVTMSRRSLVGVGLLAAAIVAGITFVFGSLWLEKHSLKPLEAHRLTFAAGLECGGSLTSDRHLLVHSIDTGDGFDLVLATVGQAAQPLQLTSTPDLDEVEASLSHDGSRIAYSAIGPNGGIAIMPATGGNHRWLLQKGAKPRWAPDDSRLAVQLGHTEPPARDVFVVPIDQSSDPISLRQRFTIDEPVHSADWLSASELVAVVGDRKVQRFDLQREAIDVLLEFSAPLKDLRVDDGDRHHVAFLALGDDDWQPYRWRIGSDPQPVGGGGYIELTQFIDGAILLTRSESQMLILGAEIDDEISDIRVVGQTGTPGAEQREYMPDLSPDGRWMAFISSRLGRPQVWLQPYPEGRPLAISEGVGEYRWPSFSFDSAKIAYCSTDVGAGDILLYDVTEGTTDNLTRSAEYEGAPDWFPDGSSLAVNVKYGNQWDLARVSWPEGEVTLLTNDAEVDIDPAVSPDGRSIAFNRDGAIHLIDLESGALRPLIPGSTPRWNGDGSRLFFQADGDLWALSSPFESTIPIRITHHAWPARHLEGVWKFSVRGNTLLYSVVDHPIGEIVLLAPAGFVPERR